MYKWSCQWRTGVQLVSSVNPIHLFQVFKCPLPPRPPSPLLDSRYPDDQLEVLSSSRWKGSPWVLVPRVPPGRGLCRAEHPVGRERLSRNANTGRGELQPGSECGSSGSGSSPSAFELLIHPPVLLPLLLLILLSPTQSTPKNSLTGYRHWDHLLRPRSRSMTIPVSITSTFCSHQLGQHLHSLWPCPRCRTWCL